MPDRSGLRAAFLGAGGELTRHGRVSLLCPNERHLSQVLGITGVIVQSLSDGQRQGQQGLHGEPNGSPSRWVAGTQHRRMASCARRL